MHFLVVFEGYAVSLRWTGAGFDDWRVRHRSNLARLLPLHNYIRVSTNQRKTKNSHETSKHRISGYAYHPHGPHCKSRFCSELESKWGNRFQVPLFVEFYSIFSVRLWCVCTYHAIVVSHSWWTCRAVVSYSAISFWPYIIRSWQRDNTSDDTPAVHRNNRTINGSHEYSSDLVVAKHKIGSITPDTLPCSYKPKISTITQHYNGNREFI